MCATTAWLHFISYVCQSFHSLFVDGQLYWFQFFAILNRAAINMGVQIMSSRMWSSLGMYQGKKKQGQVIALFGTFLGNLQTDGHRVLLCTPTNGELGFHSPTPLPPSAIRFLLWRHTGRRLCSSASWAWVWTVDSGPDFHGWIEPLF